ncbi:MAG: hypothetical protein PHO62_07935 [Sulfurimonas sp.]|nr:hypothetical protein [Sulfurimonas sp.]MDD5373337.1 hypothetical protein [Sulfurimonas sp.]
MDFLKKQKGVKMGTGLFLAYGIFVSLLLVFSAIAYQEMQYCKKETKNK